MIVRVQWNSNPDGSPADSDTENYSLYGPFDNEAEARHWMDHIYPDDDTDVHDMFIDHEDTLYSQGELDSMNSPDSYK